MSKERLIEITLRQKEINLLLRNLGTITPDNKSIMESLVQEHKNLSDEFFLVLNKIL